MKSLFQTVLTISLLLMFLQLFQNELLFKREAIYQGQWWRLISGSLVHSNMAHLMLNLAGLWVAGFLFYDKLSALLLTTSLVYLVIATGIGLFYFSPQLEWYVGLSGALYGLFLTGAVCAIKQRDYLIGFGVLIIVIGKTAWDIFFDTTSSTSGLIGVPVAADAHLYGMIAAVVPAAYCLLKDSTRLDHSA